MLESPNGEDNNTSNSGQSSDSNPDIINPESSTEESIMSSTSLVDAPGKFDFAEPKKWPAYRLRFERFIHLTDAKKFSDEDKIGLLMYNMEGGDEAMKQFKFEEETCPRNFKNVLDKFDQYFWPKKNIIFERCMFNNKKQEEGESAETFIREVWKLAEHCEYKDKEEMIRDRLVVGIRDKKLSEELRNDSELTLDKAQSKIKSREQMKKEQAVLIKQDGEPSTSTNNVDAINRKPRYHKKATGGQQRPANQQSERPSKGYPRSCGRCGAEPSHAYSVCPARKAICRKCSLPGHYDYLCRTRPRRINYRKQKKVTEIHEGNSSSSYDSDDNFLVDIDSVCSKERQSKPWRAVVAVGEPDTTYPIRVKVDSGADVTVLSVEQFMALEPEPKWSKPKRSLYGPSGNKLPAVAVFKTRMQYKENSCVERTYVVEGLKENLLSRQASVALGLLQFKGEEEVDLGINEIKKDWNPKVRFPKLFTGIGRMKTSYKIKLREDAQPFAIASPRRIPHPWRAKVKTRIKELEEKKVLSKVTVPTKWCGALVVVPKGANDVRLCIHSDPLNRAIIRDRIILPSVEETLGKMAGAKVFSKLDCKDSFWQIPLDEESRLLTTFVTPWGRYCYNVLFMGMNCASEFFHYTLSSLLSDMEGVVVHIDDIAVFGNDMNEHDMRLEQVLRRLQEFGVTLNDKCIFRVNSMRWVGHIVSARGAEPDPDKVKAIEKMPAPADKAGVKSFVARTQFLRKFIPNMAHILTPLTDLLKQENDFFWGEAQEKAFTDVKRKLTSAPILTLYDTNKDHRIASDSSAYGLGGVLEQLETNDEWKPVAYISRRLAAAESRYAIIEKEATGIEWACRKFEEYVLGKPFQVLTDHKPLVAILGSKRLDEMTPRLQRIKLKLLRYDFTIKHVAGKDFHLPDLLSRSPLPEEEAGVAATEIEEFGNDHMTNFPAGAKTLADIKKAQDEDPVIQELKTRAINGFPPRASGISPQARAYWKVKDHLTIQKDYLLYDTRLVIPHSLRANILQRLHEGHMGIEKCKSRARQSVYWPGMHNQILQKIESCEKCCMFRQNRVEPLITSDIPERPWQIIGMDLAELNKKHYLIFVDYYSKYPEVVQLKKIDSKTTINACKEIFSRHGSPETIRCDNGRQFISLEFEQFASEYGCKIITSSPRYPRSNGQAEAAVKIVKNIIKRESDPFLGLLAYRSTPISGIRASPAQLLMGRQLRTTVPTFDTNLKPKLIPFNQFAGAERLRKEKMRANHDRHHGARKLRQLGPGDKVWITDLKRMGTIRGRTTKPRSYEVQSKQGVVRRNRINLIPLNQENPVSPPSITPKTSPAINPTTPPTTKTKSPRQNTPTTVTVHNQAPIQHPEPDNQHPSPPILSPQINPTERSKTRFGREIHKPKRLNL